MIFNFNRLMIKHSIKLKGVIHIGGYVGEEYNLYLQNDVKDIIFFEPIQEHFNVLKSNVGHRPELVRKALGNENKRIEMNISKSPGGFQNGSGASSSMLNPKLHLTHHPHITFDEKREVDMIRLDDFWPKRSDLNKEDYNFINIDIQGYELEAFRGAKETLETIDHIISEVNREEVYEGCVIVDELDEFLESFNFQRLETNWQGGIWGDAFYSKVSK